MSRVFLTGGGGFIGGALATALRERGDEVVGLARTDAAAQALSARGAQVVRGDVLDADALARALAGCDLAYHVAGVNSHCPKDPARLMRVNVEGTEQVVRAAALAGVRRVVFTSSAASIGEAEGTVGTEQSPHRGSYLSLYDQSKHDAERVAFAAGVETGVEVVALNPSSVQGPPRKGGNGAIIIAFLNGRLRAFVDTYVSVVDVQDVVAAHLLAAERGTPGQRYILNGATIPSADALAIVSDLTGLRQRVPMVPPALARGAATLVERVLRLRGKTSPICRARVDTILHGHRYDGSRATRELGLAYTPVADTFRRTIEWAVAEGLVTRELPARRRRG
ncbi:NAD-dependent epimerase/dehydratase family protein [Conexibacter sp. CPCC 206217]|uniref:NAD-dependent epimerase/dehydratase family protein n=1 Tax=Conexibacter sp. CPCC 206217 TaxID=3064574 RepID=UPI00271C9B12|nr:NAD-dependent epimerase/dehydratase family protein [Conexibacter sp. CPCC 206217]MDO8213300.1 NAD-dependent epimerase/dehydratase family protein [Conexibacter sp. CPCC 206217]